MLEIMHHILIHPITMIVDTVVNIIHQIPVVVANELDKEPIEDVNDELKLVIVLVNPDVVVETLELNELILELKLDVVVAILELNDVFPLNNELILADTEELNDCKSIPSTLPVKSIEPLTIILSPNTILLPPDEVILKPSCICVVPLIDIIPFVDGIDLQSFSSSVSASISSLLGGNTSLSSSIATTTSGLSSSTVSYTHLTLPTICSV